MPNYERMMEIMMRDHPSETFRDPRYSLRMIANRSVATQKGSNDLPWCYRCGSTDTELIPRAVEPHSGKRHHCRSCGARFAYKSVMQDFIAPKWIRSLTYQMVQNGRSRGDAGALFNVPSGRASGWVANEAKSLRKLREKDPSLFEGQKMRWEFNDKGEWVPTSSLIASAVPAPELLAG